MVWLIDGSYEKDRLSQRYGWRRIVVSQLVWERCVAVPEGVRGQREGDRFWDLTCFIQGALLSGPALDDRPVSRVDFYAGVVNDNRHEYEDDGRDWPTSMVPLVARAGVDDDGSSCLVVTFPGETLPR